MKYKLLMCLAILANSSYIYSNENIIKTDSGITHGYIKNGTINWDDIPYAMPPTNDLRWKAPRKIKSTSQIIQPKENNFCVNSQVEWAGQMAKVGFLELKTVYIWILKFQIQIM
jgi:para-nitrobenzyl esterase